MFLFLLNQTFICPPFFSSLYSSHPLFQYSFQHSYHSSITITYFSFLSFIFSFHIFTSHLSFLFNQTFISTSFLFHCTLPTHSFNMHSYHSSISITYFFPFLSFLVSNLVPRALSLCFWERALGTRLVFFIGLFPPFLPICIPDFLSLPLELSCIP